MEKLERIIFLARSHELYRLARNLFDRKRRASACVAVHLCKDEPIKSELLMELLRTLDGVLTQHRIRDEKDFVRFDRFLDFVKFFHQRFVNVEPSGSIDNQDVMSGVSRFSKGILAQLNRFIP